MPLFRKRSAIFVDMDNLTTVDLRGVKENLPRWLSWLEDGAFAPRAGRRRFVVKRAYWNGMENRRRPAFEAAGFAALPCRPQAQRKREDNLSAVDLRMAIEAVDCAHRIWGLNEVFLFSGDSDFVPVARLIKDRGVKVIAIADETNATSAIWREFADHVIEFCELRAAFGYDGPGQPAVTPEMPDPAEEPPWTRPAAGFRARPSAPRLPLRAPPKPPVPIRSDLASLADAIVEAARAAPGKPIGKRVIIQLARGVLPGFKPMGPFSWFGWGGYPAFMAEVLRLRGDALETRQVQDGAIATFAREAPASAPPG